MGILMAALFRGERTMTYVKSIFAIIVTAAYVSGYSQAVIADELATGINYEADSENIRTLEFRDIRGSRFCELFFIKVKDDMKELHVYNPTGLNKMSETGDSSKEFIPLLNSMYRQSACLP